MVEVAGVKRPYFGLGPDGCGDLPSLPDPLLGRLIMVMREDSPPGALRPV